MSDFQVHVLGVGDTFSEHHNPTALVLDCAGHRLAIDCPDMYRKVLREYREKSGAQLRLSHIDAFLITHLHGDHINGLEGVAFFKRFAHQRRTRVHATPELTGDLWERRLSASMGQLFDGQAIAPQQLEDYLDLKQLDWHAPNAIGPFCIQLYRTLHHVPTCALRIAAGGRTLGYSCDTAFDPKLIDFLSPADLIIHETNLGAAHTPLSELSALPDSIKKKLRLIHYPDGFQTPNNSFAVAEEGELLRV
jgi:ribonuclease BN (tRNA processing enzyme)